MKNAICLVTILVLSTMMHSCLWLFENNNMDEWSFVNDPSFSEYEEIYNDFIGPSGGEIQLKEITVKIPTDAFTVNEKIRIFSSNTIKPFGSNTASNVYVIQGLKSIHKDVVVSFEYNGDGDEAFIGVGKAMYSSSLDTIDIIHLPVKTEVIQNKVDYIVSAEYNPLKSAEQGSYPKDLNELSFCLLDQIKDQQSENGKYLFYYENDENNDTSPFEDYLQVVENAIEKFGFDLSARNLAKHPLPVVFLDISKYEKGTFGYYFYTFKKNGDDASFRDGINDGIMLVDESLLKVIEPDTHYKEIVAHEYLHFVQNLYEFNPTENPDSSTLWIREASATWFGGYMSGIEKYCSSMQDQNKGAFTKGWQSNDASRGYGLSFLFNELYERTGSKGILNVFEKIKSGTLPGDAYDPVVALYSSTDTEFASVFWHEALKKFISGDFYGKDFFTSYVTTYFRNNGGDNRTILSDENLNGTFIGKGLNNLSAFEGLIWYTNKLNTTNWENPVLKISIDKNNNKGLLAFFVPKLGSKEVEYAGEIVPNVESSLQIDLNQWSEGDYLYLVYTHGHYNPDVPAVNGSIKYEIAEEDSTQVEEDSIQMNYLEPYKIVSIAGYSNITNHSGSLDVESQSLVWDNNKFELSFNYSYNHENTGTESIVRVGNIAGEIYKKNGKLLVKIKGENSVRTERDNTVWDRVEKIDVTDLPFALNYNGEAIFGINFQYAFTTYNSGVSFNDYVNSFYKSLITNINGIETYNVTYDYSSGNLPDNYSSNSLYIRFYNP